MNEIFYRRKPRKTIKWTDKKSNKNFKLIPLKQRYTKRQYPVRIYVERTIECFVLFLPYQLTETAVKHFSDPSPSIFFPHSINP